MLGLVPKFVMLAFFLSFCLSGLCLVFSFLCLVWSYLVLSRRVLSCLVVSRLVLPCLVFFAALMMLAVAYQGAGKGYCPMPNPFVVYC